jgi:hypothetical protein
MLETLRNELFTLVHGHDYSHMFSDSHSVWEAGMRSENTIKAKIHAIFTYHREDMENLYHECLNARPEQYADGLTHKTIKNWFSTYINE